SEYPYLEYRLLDIEQHPTEQGYESHRFDIVIAAQVLHVTKNLGQALDHVRSLLAPGGILLLWEITQWSNVYFDVSWPILPPFEENDELRNRSYASFFTREQWYDALRQYGFVEVDSFPKMNALNSHILMAQAAYPTTQSVSSEITEKVIQPKTIQHLKKKSDIADWFYIPSWKRALLPTQNQAVSQHPWLVFIDESGLGAQIVKKREQEGQSVISVKVGATFSVVNNNTYTLNPQRDTDYQALLKALHTVNQIPTTIIHLWNTTSPDDQSDSEQLEQYQNLGFYSLLFLAQALGKQNITDTINIEVVSNNVQKVTGHEVLCPEKATLLGPCRVIPQEYPNIRCRSIDIVLPESNTSAEQRLIDQLLSEFKKAEQTDSVIAYRDNERWVSSFEAIRLEKNSGLSKLREKGVYLITGGLGGIGLTLAEYLAKTVQAKLILTMRSAFPAKNEWSQWLTTHHKQDSVSRKIRKLQTIETLGSEILIISADVADAQQMQAAISQSLKHFAHIHGVIHSAGVAGGGVIQRKTRETAESVLASKVKGTRVLETLFKEINLDFFVLCSSLDSIFGVFGQVDYCAANAFLNAFADYKASKNNFIVSINWDGWQEVGMAAEAKKQHVGTLPIAPKPQYQEIAHPLFDKVIVEDAEKTIYISHLSVSKQWVLDEHQVMGKATLPGTAYLEMARAAFENQTNHHGVTEIKGVYLLAPLTVEENEEKTVRTILTKREQEFEFVISSQVKSETWQEHARGQIAYPADAKRPDQYDITTLEKNCHEQEIALSQDALTSSADFITFGPRWNNLKWVKLGPNQGLAFLELPESFSADLKQYQLHPALLDVATGFTQIKNEKAYLPFAYKKLRITGPLPAKIYSYITFTEHNPSHTLKLNIQIMDEQGQGLVEIEDYTLRRVDATPREKPLSESDNFSLEIASRGLLDTLTFHKTIRQQADLGEVEIEVSATGLNFKEVLWALGILPSDLAVQFGLECAGKIVAIGKGVKDFQIGDEVMAFTEGSFSRYVTTSASSVVPKPAHLTMEEAATIPVAFMTAYYALHHLGRLSQGERVLIHAASGGVGLAAVQIAQMIGAEIFATAGNPEKRAFLHSLGIEHVMDSRTLAFAEEVMKRTEGEGVNVVLNSLVGEFIPKSLSVLAPFGRFLEIGRRDIYENRPLGLQLLEKGLSFFVVNLSPEIPNFSQLFNELIQHLKAQHLTPLPHQVWPITEVVSAFQYMARAKHIGKIVVYQDKELLKKVVSREVTRQSESLVNQPLAHHTLPESPSTDINLFQKELKEGLLSTEGIEVFKRILHSKQPHIFVSTWDLQTRLKKVSTLLDNLKEKAGTPQSVHSRPKLKTDYVAPHNELEQSIIEVWKKFFCIDSIGIFDDFFELGGDSLMAVQLVAELRRTIQVDLSAHSLLENPTVAALVESIQTLEDVNVKVSVDLQSLPHSLVEIQAGNSLRQPVFLVHPIGGHIYIYRDLASRLGNEQPVYGFKAKGVDEETQPLTQIEEMATHYINALQVIQPKGPYILGGHSFGGFVAFEMAQQLSRLGQEVALLFMMDTVGPEYVLINNQDSDEVQLIAYALGLDINIDFPIPSKQFNQLPLEEKIRYFYEQSDIAGKVYPFHEFISHTRHFIDVIKANNQAMNHYIPNIFHGKILFFRAQDDQLLPSNHERSWIHFATEGLDIHEVPGNHTSMNLSPNVEVIANLLKAYLQ
ncbi:MAG: SDR family NAD(P)-dependent oxidoreductase, partial [Candidatus Parabeggiatoa sp.]|nr:SDR family NAD(P)-dependent oxidoreductase [Candidatus Parabeggiatoa sp.]